MKQAIRKLSFMLMLTLFLTAFIPMSAHAAKALSVAVNGETVKKITLNVGDKIPLTVMRGEKTLVPTKVKYTSSSKSIAKVTRKGYVKAKKAGKATITVRYKKRSGKLKVVVLDPNAKKAESSSGAGTITCSQGSNINVGEVITLTLNKTARANDWTWEFSGTCAKDARILTDTYKKNGKITFTVWPSGGTLSIAGKDLTGHTIGCSFSVKQSAKWKKREQYRTDALAGLTPGMSQKDMVVYFADYIADRAKYGSGNGNFFRVIDLGVGDCWCYSTAFKLLADAVGIETIIVKNSLSHSHYWNQVNLNGIWYNVDVQGYDTGKSHNWILSSDKKHGSRWLGDPNFYSQYSIHYPVSQAHACSKTLSF